MQPTTLLPALYSLALTATTAFAAPLTKRENAGSSSSLVGTHNPSVNTPKDDTPSRTSSNGLPAGAIVGIVLGFILLLALVLLALHYLAPNGRFSFARAPKWGRHHGQDVSYAHSWPGSREQSGKSNRKSWREVANSVRRGGNGGRRGGVGFERIESQESAESAQERNMQLKFNGTQKLKVVEMEKSLPRSPEAGVGIAT